MSRSYSLRECNLASASSWASVSSEKVRDASKGSGASAEKIRHSTASFSADGGTLSTPPELEALIKDGCRVVLESMKTFQKPVSNPLLPVQHHFVLFELRYFLTKSGRKDKSVGFIMAEKVLHEREGIISLTLLTIEPEKTEATLMKDFPLDGCKPILLEKFVHTLQHARSSRYRLLSENCWDYAPAAGLRVIEELLKLPDTDTATTKKFESYIPKLRQPPKPADWALLGKFGACIGFVAVGLVASEVVPLLAMPSAAACSAILVALCEVFPVALAAGVLVGLLFFAPKVVVKFAKRLKYGGFNRKALLDLLRFCHKNAVELVRKVRTKLKQELLDLLIRLFQYEAAQIRSNRAVHMGFNFGSTPSKAQF